MSDKKVLNTFQTRRQLAQAFQSMEGAASELAQIEIAHSIVDSFPADLVLSSLVKQLDTSSSQFRSGLGHIATLLPGEQAIPALRSAVADRNNSPQMRITASIILERYLGETLPSALTNDLDNSNEAAFQSLNEAIELGKENPQILLEYVTQLRQTDVEVAPIVMDMLERIAAVDRVEILRLIAQDDRPLVAIDAVQRLELLGKSEAAQQAARALHTLTFALAKPLSEQAERSLRKLRFGGVSYEPPAPDGWYALISAADPSGHQTVWLVHYPPEAGAPGKVLGFVLNYQSGVRQMFGSEDLPVEYLPRRADIGSIVPIDMGNGRPISVLSTPFDYGRWLVLKASRASVENWAENADSDPLPDEYKLYNGLIWQYARPQIDPEIERSLLDIDPTADRERYGDQDVDEATRLASLADDAAELLNQPSMRGWSSQNIMLAQAVRPLRKELANLPNEVVVQQIQREIANLDESSALVEVLALGLRAQGAWLHYAGDEANAKRAMRLAFSMQRIPLSQNPVLGHMIGLGLTEILKGK